MCASYGSILKNTFRVPARGPKRDRRAGEEDEETAEEGEEGRKRETENESVKERREAEHRRERRDEDGDHGKQNTTQEANGRIKGGNMRTERKARQRHRQKLKHTTTHVVVGASNNVDKAMTKTAVFAQAADNAACSARGAGCGQERQTRPTDSTNAKTTARRRMKRTVSRTTARRWDMFVCVDLDPCRLELTASDNASTTDAARRVSIPPTTACLSTHVIKRTRLHTRRMKVAVYPFGVRGGAVGGSLASDVSACAMCLVKPRKILEFAVETTRQLIEILARSPTSIKSGPG